ncbi:MAG: hypothetical protein WBP81_20810 [Solirubrobacteraceae bacterium]
MSRPCFGQVPEVRIEVAPEVLHVIVPVLAVVPLVGNSVRHGRLQ